MPITYDSAAARFRLVMDTAQILSAAPHGFAVSVQGNGNGSATIGGAAIPDVGFKLTADRAGILRLDRAGNEPRFADCIAGMVDIVERMAETCWDVAHDHYLSAKVGDPYTAHETRVAMVAAMDRVRI